MKTFNALSVLFLVFLTFGCATTGTQADGHMDSHAKMTKHFEKSIFKVTEKGLFSVELLLPEHGAELGVNKVDIIVHNARDEDVTGADLTVTPWMPSMDHGVKEKPVISEHGGGLYTVSNVVLSMTGEWELKLRVMSGDEADTVTLALPPVGAMGHTHMMKAPMAGDIDQATEKMTRDGNFHVSYAADPTPAPVNRIHSWVLTIKKGGKPVEGARIKINGDMPEHGHGFPTEPEVTEYIGDGQYRIEGIKFSMPGWWVVDFFIMVGDTVDHAAFNLVVR